MDIFKRPIDMNPPAPPGMPPYITKHWAADLAMLTFNGSLNDPLIVEAESALKEMGAATKVILVFEATAPHEKWAHLVTQIRSESSRYVAHVREAFGGALLMARACDKCYCSQRAAFGPHLPARRLGLTNAGWWEVLQRLPLPAETRARLRSGIIGQEEAMHCGLIDGVHRDWKETVDLVTFQTNPI